MRGLLTTPGVTDRNGDLLTMTDADWEANFQNVMFEEWKMPVALRSVGQPDQVGELMAFCLSERASYMTGAIINIDGGTDF